MSLFNAYFKSASVSVVSKFIAIIANIAILWLSAMILEKDAFGVFMVALATITLVGLLIPGPFCSVILYHASRLNEIADGRETESLMASRALAWGSIYAIGAMLAIISLAPLMEKLFSLQGLAFWLAALSPMLLLECARRIIAVLYRARQDVEIFILYNEMLPNIFKTLFLLCAFIAMPSQEGVALAMNLALFVPLAALFVRGPIWPQFGRRVFTNWDMSYAFKNLFTYGLNQQSRGFDLILVGALSSALVAADYAIASRLGRFLLIGKQGLSQLLAPRMGALFGGNNAAVAAMEFSMTRFVGFAVAVLGSFGVLLLGEWIAGIFCDTCSNAYPILLVLSAAFVANTAFGSPEDYMTMAGHAGWNLAISVISTASMILGCFVLIPLFGGIGAALAVLAAFLIRGLGMILTVYRLDNILLVRPHQILAACIIAGLLIATAFGSLGEGACFFLTLLTMLMVRPKRQSFSMNINSSGRPPNFDL